MNNKSYTVRVNPSLGENSEYGNGLSGRLLPVDGALVMLNHLNRIIKILRGPNNPSIPLEISLLSLILRETTTIVMSDDIANSKVIAKNIMREIRGYFRNPLRERSKSRTSLQLNKINAFFEVKYGIYTDLSFAFNQRILSQTSVNVINRNNYISAISLVIANGKGGVCSGLSRIFLDLENEEEGSGKKLYDLLVIAQIIDNKNVLEAVQSDVKLSAQHKEIEKFFIDFYVEIVKMQYIQGSYPLALRPGADGGVDVSLWANDQPFKILKSIFSINPISNFDRNNVGDTRRCEFIKLKDLKEFIREKGKNGLLVGFSLKAKSMSGHMIAVKLREDGKLNVFDSNVYSIITGVDYDFTTTLTSATRDLYIDSIAELDTNQDYRNCAKVIKDLIAKMPKHLAKALEMGRKFMGSNDLKNIEEEILFSELINKNDSMKGRFHISNISALKPPSNITKLIIQLDDKAEANALANRMFLDDPLNIYKTQFQGEKIGKFIKMQKKDGLGQITLKNQNEITYKERIEIIFLSSAQDGVEELNTTGLTGQKINELLKTLVPNNFTSLVVKIISLSDRLNDEDKVKNFIEPFQDYLPTIYNTSRTISLEVSSVGCMLEEVSEELIWSPLLNEYVKDTIKINLHKLGTFHYEASDTGLTKVELEAIEILNNISLMLEEVKQINETVAIKLKLMEVENIAKKKLLELESVKTETDKLNSKLTPGQQIAVKSSKSAPTSEEVESIAKRHKPNVLNINTASC
jgi:hypothetical protein